MDIDDCDQQLREWKENISHQRIHGTRKKSPRELFEQEMINALLASKADNTYYTYYQRKKYYLSPHLLILDELGFKRLNQHPVDEFYEIVSNRYEKGSMILTSNKSFEEWGEVFWDPVLATAIIDRIIPHYRIIVIKRESYRMQNHKQRKAKLEDDAR